MDLGTEEAKLRTNRFYKRWLTPDLFFRVKTRPNYSEISELKCFCYQPLGDKQQKKFILIPLVAQHEEQDASKIYDVKVPPHQSKRVDFRLTIHSNVYWSIVVGKVGETSVLPFLKTDAVPRYVQPLETEPHKTISLKSLQALLMNKYEQEFNTAGNRFYINVLQWPHVFALNELEMTYDMLPVVSEIGKEEELPPSSFFYFYARYKGSPKKALVESKPFSDSEIPMTVNEAFAGIQKQLSIKKEKFLPEKYESLCQAMVREKERERTASKIALTKQTLELHPNAMQDLPLCIGAAEQVTFDDEDLEVTMESLVNELGLPNFEDSNIEFDLEILSNSFGELVDTLNSSAFSTAEVLTSTEQINAAQIGNEKRIEEIEYAPIDIPPQSDSDIVLIVEEYSDPTI